MHCGVGEEVVIEKTEKNKSRYVLLRMDMMVFVASDG